MPDMSGLDFAKAYSANGGKAPIFLLTGHEENILSESNLSD